MVIVSNLAKSVSSYCCCGNDVEMEMKMKIVNDNVGAWDQCLKFVCRPAAPS